MSDKPASVDESHPKVLVQNAADLNRLGVRLLTHWTLPRIEIHIESLPAVLAQMFQNRITRISNAPTGGLAVILGSTTVVIGFARAWLNFHSLIWTPRELREYLALLAIATLYAAVIGKGIGMFSRRVRLVLVLQSLRRRLASGKVIVSPARYAGSDLPRSSAKAATAAEAHANDEVPFQPTMLSRPRRPKVILRNIADLRRLLIHLFTHLKLPLVQISIDGVAPLNVQRAQHRALQLSETCNCLLGAVLAGATLLVGAFSAAWLRNYNWDWWVPESWGSLGLVSTATLCAALTGIFVEMIWTRVKLMLVLRGVRHQLGT